MHRSKRWSYSGGVSSCDGVSVWILRANGLTTALRARLDPSNRRYDEIIQRHQTAVDQRIPVYRDPVSGFSVFTSLFLADRGYCCQSGCRHCPYVDNSVSSGQGSTPTSRPPNSP